MKIENIIKKSNSLRQLMMNLGWNVTGTNYKKINAIIKEKKLNTDHFLSKEYYATMNSFKHVPLNEILVKDSKCSKSTIKQRIIKEKLLNYKCLFCGNDGDWMGKKFSLILDHINGINNDNRIENLRFLCPNCNATLDTHCGKNAKNMNRDKIKLYKDCSCGNRMSFMSECCYKCSRIKMRLVERPSIEVLKKELKNSNYSAMGRKYGVSDNAIRKWIKN